MKKEKGSITLYVLIACIFFVIILSIVYTNVVHKKQAQEESIAQIQENYAGNISETNNNDNNCNCNTSEILQKVNEMSQQIEQQNLTIASLNSEIQNQQQTITSLNSDLASRGTYKWSDKLLKTKLDLYQNNICELSIEKGYWLILFSATINQSDARDNYSYQPQIVVNNCIFYSGDVIYGTNTGNTDGTAEMSMSRFVEVNSTTTVSGGASVYQPNTTVYSAKITAIKIK